jgi:hypothetical protein
MTTLPQDLRFALRQPNYSSDTLEKRKSARLKLLIEALKRPLPQLVAVLRLLRFCRLLLGFSAQSKKKRPTS